MLAPRRLMDRLVDWQLRRPLEVLGLTAAITLLMAFFASRLTLRTRYDALLPDDAPSVQELRRVERKAASAQMVLVVLEGNDRGVLRRLGDRIVPALLATGPEVVSSCEDGPHEARAFIAPRAGLFLEKSELAKLDADITARWDFEVMRRSGFGLDDQDGPPPVEWRSFEEQVQKASQDRGLDRFPDGYYERSDGTALVVVAHSPIAGGDLTRMGRALARIENAVEGVRASAPEFAPIKVSYAGDLPTGYREYGVVTSDLLGVGAAGIALVLAAVIFYFLRVRAVVVMAITIAVGLLWTFGLTQLVIGHLNVATAFLVSIVAGNGINVGILYQSRYFEERGRGLLPKDAVRSAIFSTWKPTAIAAAASAASYGSLLVTDFRAFRDFGFIAASGMVLCWVVKTLMVPPLLVLLDRAPQAGSLRGWRARHAMSYGRAFAWLVPKAPALFVAAGVLAVTCGIVSALHFVRNDPMEYDLRKTETDRSQTADLHHAWDVAKDVLGASQGAMVIAADSADESSALLAALRERWQQAPAANKPFVAAHGLSDFVPAGQAEKLPALESIREHLVRAHDRGLLPEKDWTRIRDVLPPEGLVPYGLADVPASVAGPFTDKGGVRGALITIESDPKTADDLRRLVRFADAFRQTALPSGKVVRGSGSAVILADMLRAVVRDVPRAIALSFGLTLVMVLVAFRRGPYLLSVLFALAAGCGGVACFVTLAHVKLNFLNFAALPITFGIGVDYAVNVAQRYEADGGKDILRVLRTSGGAVVLCSLTTMLGYFALVGSHNAAIRSLGAIAAVGEVSCLLAAVLVLPSLWLLVEHASPLRGLSRALQPFTPRERAMP